MNEILELFAQTSGTYATWNQSKVHPVGLVVILVLAAATLVLPRRWAALPILLAACVVPSGQRVLIAEYDMPFLRIMVLCGLLRVVSRQEYAGLRFQKLDKVILAGACVTIAAFTILRGSADAFTNRLGASIDSLGAYFYFRCLFRAWPDFTRLALSFAMVSLVVFCFFLVERSTGRNLFSVMGGVPEITQVRQGRLRCQGAFSHPILAGCFWAGALPLVGSLWATGRWRLWVVTSVVAIIGIIGFCASSTPVSGLLAGIVGWLLFYQRHRMQQLRRALVAAIVAMHIVKEQPVWHVLAQVAFVGGSTGWHRYHLIDQAIKHFREWAVMGQVSTGHWGYGLQDVTCQYVLEAVRGGLLNLVLFVWAIVLAYKNVGAAMRRFGSARAERALSWAVGVALTVHVIAFIGVSYFGQITILWWMTLALAAGLGHLAETAPKPRRVRLVRTGVRPAGAPARPAPPPRGAARR